MAARNTQRPGRRVAKRTDAATIPTESLTSQMADEVVEQMTAVMREGLETRYERTSTEMESLARRSAERAIATLRADGATARALGPLGAVAATEADITDEAEKAGPAFGNFVEKVGLAVANAQAALDKNMVDTALKLSDTQIDVIAIFEQELNDDGTMKQGNVIKQKLPLINFLMPTAYQWSRVFLQADMQVSEFNAANGFNIKGTSFTAGTSASVSTGLAGLFGSGIKGSFDTRLSTFNQSAEASVSQDRAAGQMHMEATLEPRGDVQLPRPFILQKGPQMKLSVASLVDTPAAPANGNVPATAGRREITLQVDLTKANGDANTGKKIEFRLSQPLLGFSTTPADGRTDNAGKLTITISRDGANSDLTKPMPVNLRVWLGLVNETLDFTL
jgi:hypothetical protein